MQIEIKKQIEVLTETKILGFNMLIQIAKESKNIKDFSTKQTEHLLYTNHTSLLNFSFHYAECFILVYEMLPNGEKSSALLFIY